MGRRRTLKKHSSKRRQRRQRLLSLFARRGGGYPTDFPENMTGNVASKIQDIEFPGFVPRGLQRRNAQNLGDPDYVDLGINEEKLPPSFRSAAFAAMATKKLKSPDARSRRRSRRRSRQRSLRRHRR